MDDTFTPYEKGLKEFRQKLGDQHERLQTFLNYEHRLSANVQQARDYGDTPALSAERNQIVDQLNALALETVKTSFNEMCGLERQNSVLTMPLVVLPSWAVLFFNLVVVIILAPILRPLVSTWLPCIPSIASALSLAIILLMLFHLAWRSFNPIIKASGGTVKVSLIAVPIQVLASLADALHPWPLLDSALWIFAIAISLMVGVLGMSPLSPFPPPREEPPIVQGFSVQFLDRTGMTIAFSPGDLVELGPDEQVRVHAETLGKAIPLCTWSATNGRLQSAEGCSILYSAPFHEVYDFLEVQAQPPCRTQSAYASLHIRIVSGD
ncbi:MAG: hypothetical protein DRI48_00880 [Chloroflexi bacterium]|nr:MAG: hypothetical protein DRI48_00880 [Chloroflexota bacterium]